jgi:hypothetical protein
LNLFIRKERKTSKNFLASKNMIYFLSFEHCHWHFDTINNNKSTYWQMFLWKLFLISFSSRWRFRIILGRRLNSSKWSLTNFIATSESKNNEIKNRNTCESYQRMMLFSLSFLSYMQTQDSENKCYKNVTRTFSVNKSTFLNKNLCQIISCFYFSRYVAVIKKKIT